MATALLHLLPGSAAHADGPDRMDGRVYEILLTQPGSDDHADRLLFREGTLESFQLRRLDYGPGPCVFEELHEGWIVRAEMNSAAGGHALWQANVQEDAIEGALSWTRSDGSVDTLVFNGSMLPPLYHRIGGLSMIAEIVDDFVDGLVADTLVSANPRVAGAWGRVSKPALKFSLTAYLAHATGGPEAYTGRSLRDAHAALGITAAEWEAMRADLERALLAHRVPATERDEVFHAIEAVRGEIVPAHAGHSP